MKLQSATVVQVGGLIFSTHVDAAATSNEKRLDNGLGLKPALGWNSWNAGQCNAATAKFALDTANKFISLGLKDLGYQYVNIDDCWSSKQRNSSGHLVPDPSKWPNGIKPVADQIHSMGLKFGLYGCAGTLTCAGFPGSEGNELKDAQTLASWGVDYWKYDNCYTPCNGGTRVQTCNSPAGNTKTWMTTMSNALEKSGGKIAAEEKTHFGLWAMAKSPIILGNDLSKISSATALLGSPRSQPRLSRQSRDDISASGATRPSQQPNLPVLGWSPV